MFRSFFLASFGGHWVIRILLFAYMELIHPKHICKYIKIKKYGAKFYIIDIQFYDKTTKQPLKPKFFHRTEHFRHL
jgi:hypothetical protein